MVVSRRQLLAGGATGVGLAVAGTVPTLNAAQAAPAPRPAPGRMGGRSHPWWTTRQASWPCPKASGTA